MSDESAEAGGGVDAGSAGAPESVGDGGGDGAPGAAPEAAAPAPAPDWRSAIPEDVRGSPSLQNIESIEDLATQFVNAQGLIGNSIRIPSDNASDEDRAAFRQKLLEKVEVSVSPGPR